MRWALTDAVKEIRQDAAEDIEARYNIGSGGFSKNSRYRSKWTQDGADITVTGYRLKLSSFMTDKGGKDKAPSVNIIGDTKSMQPGDFYARVNSAARIGGDASFTGMIFRPEEGTYKARYKQGVVVSREGRGRIRGLVSVGVPNMMNADAIKPKIEDSAGKQLEEALTKAVDKAFDSIG